MARIRPPRSARWWSAPPDSSASCTCRRSAEVVADAMIAAIKELPPTLRRTVTWDQGHEMLSTPDQRRRGHRGLLLRPTLSWQRGSNENTNGLLRYFPKGTDLSLHTANTSATSLTTPAVHENGSAGITPPTASTTYSRPQQKPLLQPRNRLRAAVDLGEDVDGRRRVIRGDAHHFVHGRGLPRQ